MQEIWKDIEDFIGYYKVSNIGNIKSLDRMVWNGHKYWKMQGRILKPGKDRDGYLIVNLHKDGKKKICKVHRLVAKAFIPNPNNFPEVNHKKGNKKDNRYFMLEWCTPKQNVQHAIRTGLITYKKGKENPMYGKLVGEKNPMFGKHHSEETKIKMSISQKEYIKRNGSASRGRVASEETRKKLSQASKGTNNPKARKVICMTTNEKFDYIALGAKKYKIDGTCISACCRGKQKTAGKHPITNEGLVWKYEKERASQ